MGCSMPDSTILHCLPEFAQIQINWIGGAIKPSYPLLPPSSFAFNLSTCQGLLQRISSFHQVAKVSELQLQHQSYSGLISFKNDWFDLLAVQGTLRSLLQHRSLKASILWHLAFFMVQLSHWYMTTENTMKWKWSRSVVSDSSRPHGLYSTRLLCPWNFPGKNAGVGCHFLKWCLYSLIRCIGLS